MCTAVQHSTVSYQLSSCATTGYVEWWNDKAPFRDSHKYSIIGDLIEFDRIPLSVHIPEQNCIGGFEFTRYCKYVYVYDLRQPI